MRKSKCLIILAVLAMLFPLSINAFEVEINGLRYDLGSTYGPQGAEVIRENEDVVYQGDIVVPASVTYDGQTYTVENIIEDAFSNNEKITSIDVQADIKEIGRILNNCTNLKRVVFADGPERFYATFEGCTSLTDVTLPATTKYLDNDTFNNCSSLASLTIPGSVEEFYCWLNGCERLETIKFENSDNALTLYNSLNCPLKNIYIGRTISGLTDGWTSTLPGTVEKITIGGNTIIPENAFKNLGNLRQVNFEDGNIEIGNGAFQYCTRLQAITIPASVKKIGTSLFYGCTGLKTASISEEFTEIPDQTFSNCDSLTTVSLSDKVETIGNEVFANCTSLNNLTLPDGLKTIRDRAFYRCLSLTSLVIPESVDSLGSSVFSNCTSLTSITLPSGTTKINGHMFEWCSALESFTLPDLVETIEEGAFSECKGLQEIHIGDKVKYIGDGAFQNCKKLKKVYYNGNLNSWLSITNDAESYMEDTCPLSYASEFYVNSGSAKEQLIQDLTIPGDVTTIKTCAFAGYKGIKSLTIPETVDSISRNAFAGCTGLTDLVMRAKYVGEEAFWGCYNLRNVTLGARMRTVERLGFYTGSYLNKTTYEGNLAGWCGIRFNEQGANIFTKNDIYIDGNLLEGDIVIPCNFVNDYVFYGNKTLTSITVPYDKVYIGDYAFANCDKLKTVTIGAPDNAARALDEEIEGISIGNYAYNYCTLLSEINIDTDKLSNIGGGAFEGTAWYDSQPDGLLYLGKIAYAYKGTMPENTSITIAEGTTALASSIFGSQYNLKSVVLPSSLKKIGSGAFGYCSGLTSINLPQGIEEIGQGAFRECSSLTHVDLPASLKRVESYLFYECSALQSVTIPAEVTSMGSQIFYYCNNLKEMTSSAAVPPACDMLYSEYIHTYYNDTFFGFMPYMCKLTVPVGSADAYRNAEGWKQFTDIEEANLSGITSVTTDTNGHETHYDISGKVVSPSAKGLHIVRKADGTTRKVIVK